MNREATPDPRDEDLVRVYQHVHVLEEKNDQNDVRVHVENHYIEMVCDTKQDSPSVLESPSLFHHESLSVELNHNDDIDDNPYYHDDQIPNRILDEIIQKCIDQVNKQKSLRQHHDLASYLTVCTNNRLDESEIDNEKDDITNIKNDHHHDLSPCTCTTSSDTDMIKVDEKKDMEREFVDVNLPQPYPTIQLDTDKGNILNINNDDNENDKDNDKLLPNVPLEPFYTDKGTDRDRKQGEKSFDHSHDMNIDIHNELEGFQPGGHNDYMRCNCNFEMTKKRFKLLVAILIIIIFIFGALFGVLYRMKLLSHDNQLQAQNNKCDDFTCSSNNTTDIAKSDGEPCVTCHDLSSIFVDQDAYIYIIFVDRLNNQF